MNKILITGSEGFIGKNLRARLAPEPGVELLAFDRADTAARLEEHLERSDFVFHLAGVNRSRDPDEFRSGNIELTRAIAAQLGSRNRPPPVLFTSSIQAGLDNPYGASKKAGEEILLDYGKRTGAPVFIYRLPNVFGKWSRPYYNSVVATFCHRAARGEELEISDPGREIELAYIDDVVTEFLRRLGESGGPPRRKLSRTYRSTLGETAEIIARARDSRLSRFVPDMSDGLTRALNATFLSFLEPEQLPVALEEKRDDRGALVEFVKSPAGGQIFLSYTRPGIVRGNHYHHTKAEKFWVIRGRGLIRLRREDDGKTAEIPVAGDRPTAVDIPPGWAHSIENTAGEEMIVLFWSSEIFESGRPDTYRSEVTDEKT